MQDKFPIIVYGEDGTHIRDLLLDLIDKFGSQLLDDKICAVPSEPFSLKTMAQSHKIVNQADFYTSIRRTKGNEIIFKPIRLKNCLRKY